METKSYNTLDKKALGWPKGPWDNEPDKIQWQDKDTGLPCLAVRHPTSGHWCGYVGVAPDHKYYGEHYDQIDVNVHGGLTFANACHAGKTEATGICHVPAAEEPDHVWWFGFDCQHYMDIAPYDLVLNKKYGWVSHGEGVYRPLSYVQKECEILAKQLCEFKE